MDVVVGIFVGNFKNFLFKNSLKMKNKNIFDDKEKNPLEWNACEIRFKRKLFFLWDPKNWKINDGGIIKITNN